MYIISFDQSYFFTLLIILYHHWESGSYESMFVFISIQSQMSRSVLSEVFSWSSSFSFHYRDESRYSCMIMILQPRSMDLFLGRGFYWSLATLCPSSIAWWWDSIIHRKINYVRECSVEKRCQIDLITHRSLAWISWVAFCLDRLYGTFEICSTPMSTSDRDKVIRIFHPFQNGWYNLAL